MFKSLTKTTAVVIGSTILATLSVNALDTNGKAVTTYLGAALLSEPVQTGPCPQGMTLVENALEPFCVDMYEASAGPACHYADPQNNDETTLNLGSSECIPVSRSNVMPWRGVTLNQARTACARADKRLLTSDEWYKASLGTPDANKQPTQEQCNSSPDAGAGTHMTGAGMRCVSDAGAFDMVGNVWEWVDGVVVKGKFNDAQLPVSGYVHGVDMYGMPVETGAVADERFNGDRLWVDPDIDAGLMRGGYYQSGTDAGIYSVYAASPPTFFGGAVGFRCASTPNKHAE